MPTKTKSKRSEPDSDVAVADEPTVNPVEAATQKVADLGAKFTAAQAELAEAIEQAKPKIGRFDAKKPTIIVEGSDGETPVSPEEISDKENGHDFKVGDYVHCANLDLSDENGQYQRWVYRPLGQR